MHRRILIRAALLLAVAGAAYVGGPEGFVTRAAAQIPPDADWRTFTTDHFRVTYSAGLEPVARRAAARAEHAYELLASELTEPPSGVIDLVIANNVDAPNGYATPIPNNRIVVYAHPPVSEPALAYYDDWLGLVVLHELVHIFHLDQAEGIWDRLRSVFGRSTVLFPHFFTTGWFLEGLATFYESSESDVGRVHGTMHEMALRTAILEDAFFSIDQASGEPDSWPGPATRYVYGSMFLAHLADRYGDDAVDDFVARYGSRIIPYRLDAAARSAFGISFSDAWDEWAATLRIRYAAQADSLRADGLTQPQLLTEHGRVANHPRFSPDGSTIAYSAATGRDEPSTRIILEDGSISVLRERNSPGPSAWLPRGDGLITAQLDFEDPYRIPSDLYLFNRSGGAEKLTSGGRVWEPHVHPDGDRVVVVADAGGTNTLAVYDIELGTVTPLTAADPDVHWSLPRWSPAGDQIAASRWSDGGFYDIVILDADGRLVRGATRDRAIDSAPAWSPDGRYVIFSSDRTGIANLFAYDTEVDELWQATNVLTGAFQPDVSPDGRWIVFSFYGSDGYDIARIPFDPSAWRPAPAPRAEVRGSVESAAAAPDSAGGESRPYSPWPSVRPTAWAPLLDSGTRLGLGVGAFVFGRDVVEKHAWSAQAMVYPGSSRFAGAAGYSYSGLGIPILRVDASQDWSVRRSLPLITARERELSASATWLRRRWRSSSWITAGPEVNKFDFFVEPDSAGTVRSLPLDLGARLEAGFSSARSFGFAFGPQAGGALVLAIEGHRFADPLERETSSRGYTRLRGRSRAFQAIGAAGFARPVLALRLDAGADVGSLSPGFVDGGSSSSSFPVRGYLEGSQYGNRAVSATAEFRFPLRLVERGYRLLPITLNQVWGDVFVDAGGAWCANDFLGCRTGGSAPEVFAPLYSVGAEILLDLQIGFLAALPLRVGVAAPLGRRAGGPPKAYIEVGRSF
jgi:Tol biopolymer transport system component